MQSAGLRLLRRTWRQTLRRVLALLPRPWRFALFRRLVDCDPAPDARLVVKIAETQEELEACFGLLHDAYVGSGYMKPHASGLRATPYHALPTTTTLCAQWDGQVVGTLSIVREGVFGFPLQQAFDLAAVRARGGNIAEISALAVHADFRATGGSILFPLLKFMYLYCTRYFDTQHLVIAVHPDRAEMYESLLFFERLQNTVVNEYGFANGAPAVGATLDLQRAADVFARVYGAKPLRKNLHHYFTVLELPHLRLPNRRYFTTNDPVLTPALLDHFFNHRVAVLAGLPARQRNLLHSIYDTAPYAAVLPPRDEAAAQHPLRRHHRYSIRLPARLDGGTGTPGPVAMEVIEISLHGFQAECMATLTLDQPTPVTIDLGHDERTTLLAVPVRRHTVERGVFYGFRIDAPDAAWQRCVSALEVGQTHTDLMQAA